MTPRYCSLEVMRSVIVFAGNGSVGKFDEFSGSWNESEVCLMNCSTCDHKKRPDDGHCYMFRTAPSGVCGQHTGYKFGPGNLIPLLAELNLTPSEFFGDNENG